MTTDIWMRTVRLLNPREETKDPWMLCPCGPVWGYRMTDRERSVRRIEEWAVIGLGMVLTPKLVSLWRSYGRVLAGSFPTGAGWDVAGVRLGCRARWLLWAGAVILTGAEPWTGANLWSGAGSDLWAGANLWSGAGADLWAGA